MDNKKTIRIALTGGHISPLLAVLDTLPSNVEPFVIGRKYVFEGDPAISLEYQSLQARHIPMHTIAAGRLQRKFTRHTFRALSKSGGGFFQAYTILQKMKPDVVISFGGYVSLPVVIAAWIRQVPVVIHEQTFVSGLANKFEASFARKICISWPSSARFFPKSKVVYTGNPLRIFSNTSIEALLPKGDAPLLYITGGSSGSHPINRIIENSLPELLMHFRVLHQVGDATAFADFDRLEKIRSALSDKEKGRYVVTKYVKPQDVGPILQKSDVVIGRSGANTITELLAYGKKSILIPLPSSQNGDQPVNARFMEKIGLATILDQDDATPERFIKALQDLVQKKITAETMEEAKTLVKKDAAEKIIATALSCLS